MKRMQKRTDRPQALNTSKDEQTQQQRSVRLWQECGAEIYQERKDKEKKNTSAETEEVK